MEREHADLYQSIIYRCVVGSRAYGLDLPESDTDRRGIYLPPADRHWSLEGVPEQLEYEPAQECYWELQKFLTLALRANPAVLECLYSPLVEEVTPLAEELLTMRQAFLTRQIYRTYSGYVSAQFRKMDQDQRVRGAIRPKHAMHLIRLLLAGIRALREGFLEVRVGEERNHLLAIRHGELPWAEIEDWRHQLQREFDDAFASTTLPVEPDYARANTFLIAARHSRAREWSDR